MRTIHIDSFLFLLFGKIWFNICFLVTWKSMFLWLVWLILTAARKSLTLKLTVGGNCHIIDRWLKVIFLTNDLLSSNREKRAREKECEKANDIRIKVDCFGLHQCEIKRWIISKEKPIGNFFSSTDSWIFYHRHFVSSSSSSSTYWLVVLCKSLTFTMCAVLLSHRKWCVWTRTRIHICLFAERLLFIRINYGRTFCAHYEFSKAFKMSFRV